MGCSEKAGRISSYLRGAFEGYMAGAVHSCFRTSLNVRLGERLVHISGPARPLCCFGMEVPEAALGNMLSKLAPGDLAVCRNGRIALYGKTETFMIYTGQMEEVELGIARADTPALALTDTPLWRLLWSMDFTGRLGIAEDGRFEACCCILRAWPKSRAGAVKAVVAYLIGRGQGLTPSGDDILLGYGAGLMALDTAGGAEAFFEILSACLHRQTTDISLAYYGGLTAGYANENMACLLNGLWNGDQDAAACWLKSVEAMGHTSGCDTLFGLRLSMAGMERALRHAL